MLSENSMFLSNVTSSMDLDISSDFLVSSGCMDSCSIQSYYESKTINHRKICESKKKLSPMSPCVCMSMYTLERILTKSF